MKEKLTQGIPDPQRFLKSLVENLPNTVFAKDAKTLKYVAFNKAAESVLGYSRDRMVGKTDYDFFSKEIADTFQASDRVVLEGKDPVHVREELVPTGDGPRWFRTKKIALMDENEAPEFLLGISEDITELKNAETERYKLAQAEATHTFFMNAPTTAVIYKGPNHIIEGANPAALVHLGKQEEDLIGRPIRDAFSELKGQGIFEQMDEVYRTGKTITTTELPAQLVRNGELTTGYYNLTIQALKDPEGKSYGLITHAIDVTEQVVARLQVEALVGELRKAVDARDEFLSIASHELKTPLTSLKLQHQIFDRTLRLESLSTPSEERLKRMLAVASRQLDRLTGLIDELLDVSRIRAGKLTLTYEEIDLVALTHDLVERFSNQMAASLSEIQFDLPEKLMLYGDRTRIEQVLVNLLANAMKYGQGKPIHVIIKETADSAVIRVRDLGVGIRLEDHSKIFEPFERASATRDINGLGLGLFITHQNILAHGGKIHVESALGEGAAFTVQIPLMRLNQQRP